MAVKSLYRLTPFVTIPMASLLLMACDTSVTRRALNDFCDSNGEYVEMTIRNAKPVSLSSLDSTPEVEGLPAGTLTYWNSEVYIFENRGSAPIEDANPLDIFGIDVLHLPKSGTTENPARAWNFQTGCLRTTPENSWNQTFFVPSRIEVSGTSGVARVRVTEFLQLNAIAGMDAGGVKFAFVPTTGSGQPTDSLEKSFILNGGAANLFKRDSAEGDAAPYEVRMKYKVGNQDIYFAIGFNQWAPGVAIDSNKIFTPEAPTTP